ncbi:isocitrate lyase/PEP mutase family protein [Propionibacteriaceae bacterium G1746]|uniref:isocitrate lyase/PEP mutase family protein n=1 Tax=Aestuariimicrobium sp. G57 TaxID=3418485 RepID=UPI003C16B4CB
MGTIAARTAEFRRLHEAGCFVMPNPWDVGSARLLAGMGFAALATTSAGFAWTTGKPDNTLTLDEALAHLQLVAAATHAPLNADFQNGYALDPGDLVENVTRACGTGIAGLSIEDYSGDPAAPLLEFDFAVERIRAARAAIDDSGTGVVLTARTEGFVWDQPDLDEAIRRLVAFAEAGADCLYVPRITSHHDVAAVVSAVAPKPVNLLVNKPFITAAQAAELGVRRISTGGVLARTAWKAFLAAAGELARDGTVSGFVDLPDVDALLSAP